MTTRKNTLTLLTHQNQCIGFIFTKTLLRINKPAAYAVWQYGGATQLFVMLNKITKVDVKNYSLTFIRPLEGERANTKRP